MKIHIDSISMKIILGIVVTLLVFTLMTTYVGREVEDQDLSEEMPDKENTEDVYGENSTETSKDVRSMWSVFYDMLNDVFNGVGIMADSLINAPPIIPTLLITVFSILIVIVIARTFEVSI